MGKLLYVFIGVLSVLSVCSCSVKEDREQCPCRLSVDASCIGVADLHIKGWSAEKVVIDDVKEIKNQGRIYEYLMPRSYVNVIAYIGNNMIESGTKLKIPLGNQMDYLYLHSSSINTMCESISDIIIPHKNFVTVYLEFADSDTGMSKYDLKIIGEICGIDLRTNELIKGDFRCVPESASDKGYSFRVPRQHNSDKLLCCLCSAGETADVIDIGRLIEMTGFDWTTEDLEDVKVVANLPENEFYITVIGWDGTYSTTVII